MLNRDMSGEEIYKYKQETKKSWPELSKEIGLSEKTLRRRSTKYRDDNDLPNFANHTYGKRVINPFPESPNGESGEELWGRALSLEKRRDQKQVFRSAREVIFDKGPVALIAMGDLHLGSQGVSYSDIDRDIMMIHHLEESGVNVAVVLIGDLIDNYIIGRLSALRMTESPFLAVEEWGMVDYILEKLAPFLVGSVAGNHDNWSWALTGIELLKERHEHITPNILYDPHELAFTLRVGKFACQVMARHHWSGHSKFNPTHGIDDWQRRRGREFDIAIGGHTHRGGLAREFDNGGSVGYALLCGSYKKVDGYALRLGLPPALPTSAVTALINENGIAYATSNIEGIFSLLK